jgi:phosphoenolpyruvate carboxykinase (ATP)
MSTIEFFTNSEELKNITSAARATIMSPFYGNNVEHVKAVSEAYKLALNSPGTVELTGLPVFEPEKIGLPKVQITPF